MKVKPYLPCVEKALERYAFFATKRNKGKEGNEMTSGETLIEQLIRHEGLKLKPYKCTSGKLTIGVGRNLDDVGITKEEALYLLRNDVSRCMIECKLKIPVFDLLNNVRQNVLLNMCFQMGISGLLKFKKFLSSLEKQDFDNAAEEMLKSKWAGQTPNRAKELSGVIKKGGV